MEGVRRSDKVKIEYPKIVNVFEDGDTKSDRLRDNILDEESSDVCLVCSPPFFSLLGMILEIRKIFTLTVPIVFPKKVHLLRD